MRAPISLLRNTAWATAGRYVEYFLGMVMSVVIARALGPSDYGIYAFAIWLSHLSLLLINGGLPTALIKFLAELRGRGDEGAEGALFRRVNRFHHWTTGLFLALGAGLIGLAGDSILPGNAPGALLWLVLLATVFKASYMFRQGLAKGREDFRAIALTILVVAPGNTVAVAVASSVGAGLAGFLAVFTGAGLAYFLLLRVFLGRPPIPDPGAPERVAALRPRLHRHILLATANTLLAFLVFKQSEVLFLRLFAETSAIAYFNVAFTLSTAAATLVPGIVGTILLPAMARAVARDQATAGRTFVESTRYLWLLGLPLMAGGLLYADNLVGLLYGAEFRDAAIPLAALLVASSFHIISQGGSSYQISSDRQHVLLRLNLALVAVTLALDWVLIANYGLTGAVIAFSTTTIGSSLFLIALTCRDLGVRLPLGIALRATLAGGLALVLVWPLGWILESVAELLVGGSLFVAIYLVATLRLRCWTAADLATGHRLLKRPGIRWLVPGGAFLLDRVGARPATTE